MSTIKLTIYDRILFWEIFKEWGMYSEIVRGVFKFLSSSTIAALIGAATASVVPAIMGYYNQSNLMLAEYRLHEIQNMTVKEFKYPYSYIYNDVSSLMRGAVLMPPEFLEANIRNTRYECVNKISEECIPAFVASIQSMRDSIGAGVVSDDVIEAYVHAMARKLEKLPVEKSVTPIPREHIPNIK